MTRETMKMSCDDFTPFIDAYIDAEFDERDRVEFETHLGHCDACKAEVDFQLEFKRHLKSSLQAERAPESLRSTILCALQQESLQQHQQTQQDGRARRNRRIGFWAAPAAAAAAILIFLPAFTIAPAASTQIPVISHTVEWHQGNLPLEVQGPDHAQITRWFHGKVDFPVRLPQFKNKDARLLGARIANVQDRRAALAIYDVDGSRLSVMVFRGDGLEVPSSRITHLAGRDVALLNADGYEVAIMQDHGVTYTLTTELAQPRLISLMEESLQP